MALDYLVVGSGLTGAVIARELHDAGFRVQVVDRRSHLAGNVHDSVHVSGIRVHSYGPHYFRTSNKKVWEFVGRFATFDPFTAEIKVRFGNDLENWPIAGSYIRREIGTDWKPAYDGPVENFEQAALSVMPRAIFDRFIKEYTEKQWGKPANELAAALFSRIDIHHDDDPRLKPKATYQGIPRNGYTDLVAKLLKDIPIVLDFDFIQNRQVYLPRCKTVFTGPIDEFFGFDLGSLDYRGQKREVSYLPDTEFHQPCVQVNEPLHAGGRHIRTIEWKHLPKGSNEEPVTGTVLTRETPFSPREPNDFEYPFPDGKNRELYKMYRERADQLGDVLICGRLGEYRYMDMDQAIARALRQAVLLLERSGGG
jgi:UDP-galactopyranose mutase